MFNNPATERRFAQGTPECQELYSPDQKCKTAGFSISPNPQGIQGEGASFWPEIPGITRNIYLKPVRKGLKTGLNQGNLPSGLRTGKGGSGP